MKNERYNSSFLVPDFVDIQRKSFFHLLEKGILQEFSKVNPIVSDISQLKLTFYPERYLLILPDFSLPDAIVEGKTYSCKLYMPATSWSDLHLRSVGTDKKQISWVLLGNLPLMTKRGHFVINGSPRVLVNQLTRSPGIYFHQRRWGVGKTEKRVVYADFVSRRGAWLRLQADKAGEVWARLKRRPKIPFSLFYESMIACECNPSHWTASDQDTLIEMYEEVNPTKRDLSAQGGKAFLDRKFKNPKTYDLGLTGRDQLNRKFGTSIVSQQLTSKDLYYAFEEIKKLQNHRILADDIDNLSNRRVRAAGDLVQGQFEDRAI